MAKIFRPSKDDALKVRRELAIFLAIWALFIWPLLIAFFVMCFRLPTDTVGAFLTYVGTLAAGPIGAWIWAAQSQQLVKQRHPSDTVTTSEPERGDLI